MKYTTWRETPHDRSKDRLYAASVNDGTANESDAAKEAPPIFLRSQGKVANVNSDSAELSPNFLWAEKGPSGREPTARSTRKSNPFAVAKLLLIACLSALSFNAFSVGAQFTTDRLIKDLTWNQGAGRVEFKVLFFHDYGSKYDEHFQADLYVDDDYVARFYVPCRNTTMPMTNGSGRMTANTQIYLPPSADDRLVVYARNRVGSCTSIPGANEDSEQDKVETAYYAFKVVREDGADRAYAEFFWYPGSVISYKTIKVELKNITIYEQTSEKTAYLSNVSKTVGTMPPSIDCHITVPQLGTNGKVSFEVEMEGVTKIDLTTGADGHTPVQSKNGDNITFTDIYLPDRAGVFSDAVVYAETYHTFAQKSVSGGKTVYSLTGCFIDPPRTGEFTGDLIVTPSTCGDLILTWYVQHPVISDQYRQYTYDTQGFDLEVSKDNGNSWSKSLPSGTTVPQYKEESFNTKKTYSCTYRIPDNEMNSTISYKFRLKRKFMEWDSPRYRSLFIREASINLDTHYKGLTNMEIKTGASKYPRLTWERTTAGIDCDENIKMWLKIAGGNETEVPKDSILNGGYQTTSATLGIQACAAQRYELVLQYGSASPTSYTVNSSYVFEASTSREFEKIAVSKGYFSDRNNIKWYLRNGADDFDNFQLMRKEAGAPDEEYVSIYSTTHNPGMLQYSYDDRDINAGVYYIYKVEGMYSCSAENGSVSSPVSVGFSQPYGSVSGRVTYTGSQAVSNVRINVTTDDALSGNRELEFNGADNSYVSLPGGTRLFSRDGFSYQVWLRPSNSANAQTLLSNSLLQLTRRTDGIILISMDAVTDSIPMAVSNGEYSHLTVTAEKLANDYKRYRVKAYINDSVALSTEFALDNAASTPTDNTRLGEAFVGNMDDVRIWDRALNASEVALSYDRIIGGKEAGLAAYYKLDEIDVAENALFDCSAVGTAFNGNHAVKGSSVGRKTLPANASHLVIKGVADENGNYSILNSIPYTSEGTTYYLSPSLGIHQFDPNRRPLYFSPDSRVFNNVDFTDISSFPVSGQIVYAGSSYPVEGVQISVDGMPANKDGKAVETDAEGRFTVDVPIGMHFISVSKLGHVFADGGRFPATEPQRYNFQTSLSGLVFTDQTTVTLKGRVAGGDPQTNLPTGFGLSKANIGMATITLATVSDVYRLNLTDDDVAVTTSIGSKTTLKHPAAGSKIEIETNPKTGEFIAVLPPVPYIVTNIKTKEFEDNFSGGEQAFSYNKTTFSMNPLTADTAKYEDTATKATKVVVSHDSLKVTRYNPPTIEVKDLHAAPGAFGDSIYLYTDPLTGKQDTISLYSVANETVAYSLGYPVLSQKKLRYYWNVKAYEEYANSDGAEPVADTVPLAGSEIGIVNALAAERIDLDSTDYSEISRKESQSAIVLDSTGNGSYAFAVSFPNLGGNHTLNAKMTLNRDGMIYTWEKDAILLGQMPSDGNNFVTAGPDFVDVVLHDPPGSNSYAYIEKGSRFTSRVSTREVSTITGTMGMTLHTGPIITTSAGIGFEMEIEVEATADFETVATIGQTYTNNNEQEMTVTFNQVVSTSNDPSFVGSPADVYIGRSTNLVFGFMNQLALYPQAEAPEGVTPDAGVGSFKLFPKRVMTSNVEFGTAFHYTQSHIIETQIPNIKELRNALITPVPQEFDATSIAFGNSNVKYISYLPASNPSFGEPSTYRVYYKPGSPEEIAQKDEVWGYNTWISSWEERIRDNEEYKVTLFKKRAEYEANSASSAAEAFLNKRLFENISYDAGVSFEKSQETSYSNVTVTGSTFSVGGAFNTTIGASVNSVGLDAVIGVGGQDDKGEESATGYGSTIKFGYAFSDNNQDALSVDVYGPSNAEMMQGFSLDGIHNLTGFTFQRRAGQTSCPHEGPDSTTYYRVNDKPELLQYGTFKIENGQLYIDGSASASAENIPAGREGTFTLQMQNLSEAKMDVTYQLYADAISNPNGLILFVDGEPLTAPRQFSIKYGEEVTKILKVRQSDLGILSYENIAIRFGSVCSDDYAEARISATFTPSSSEVKLASNSRLANSVEMKKGADGKSHILFTISDYDRSYQNFGCIRLQYRNVVNESWMTLREYINDTTLYPLNSNSRELIAGPSCSYDFACDLTAPSDGEYIFRAVSVSKSGTVETTLESEEIRVVKDTKIPQVLGYPSPVNGILSAGDEISVTFNEDIQSNKLVGGTVGSNFSITGILNGDIREEPTSGLLFNGSQTASTEMPIYTNGSFSIETWFKHTNGTAGTLFAYGSGSEYIALGFDASRHTVVTVGSQSFVSTDAIDGEDTWKYIGLSYDRANSTVSVNVFQGADNLRLFESKTLAQAPATQGKLYLGNNMAGNSGFSGAAAQLHFYSAARSNAQMSATKSLTKSGSETNLAGYWELNEGEGALGSDKARSRHLNVNNASWYIYPLGKSLAFNGTSQYAKITSGAYPFGIYDDFTLELQFKGGAQVAATLLSVGTTSFIGFDAEHRLILAANGNAQLLAPAGLLDDKWHHLALSVKRNGMARALVDGKATAAFSSEALGAFGGGYYHLGAKYALGANGHDYAYSEHFSGNIDELRVWSSALTNEVIVLNKNFSLRGDEAGLKAYYPFELTQQVNGGVYSVNPSLIDKMDSTLSAEIVGEATVSDVSAPLQLARPVKNVPFTFTASSNKIVLNITEEEYRIDGVTLYASADNILDMRDNVSSTISWIAYVNRNALGWHTDMVDIIMEEGENRTFKVSISNSSGEKTDYFIEDLPAWLSVNAPQGSLLPQSTKELTFTVAQGINIGAYEAAVVLKGLNEVKKILPVSVNVTGDRPSWSVNPADFEQSMTIVGQLFIKNSPQEDAEDLVAAFVGNTCVGLVSPTYEKAYQGYLVYMQVWGNSADNGKDVAFKIWDASTGSIYPVVEVREGSNPVQIQFAGNSLKGYPATPVKLNALDAVEQSMLLGSGWSWVSFNVASPALANANELMADVDNGIEIKGQSAFSRYESSSGVWTNGTLNGAGLSNNQMYMIKMLKKNTVALPGSPLNADDTPISLNSGWSWIAYIPQVNEAVDEAFAGANPNNGDIVKSQTAFSVYDSRIGWVGTLDYLRPGLGYMYYTGGSERTFKYPRTGIMAHSSLSAQAKTSGTARSSSGDQPTAEALTLNRPYASLNGEIAPSYESNLSLIGEVKLTSGYLSKSARLIAMVGNERRGFAELRTAGNKQLFFLPVYSNSTNETVTFVLENDGQEIPLRENIPYKANALVGTPSSPMLLTDANIDLKAYPNPFSDRITISFEVAAPIADVKVELVSMTGTMLYATTYTAANSGLQLIDIDPAVIKLLSDGMYIIRVTLNNSETFTSIVIKTIY